MQTPDHEKVNFEEDYELEYILDKYNKSRSQKNIRTLRKLGRKAKDILDRRVLTHDDFYLFIELHLDELDDK